ncbi:BTB/POZ domain-containing protein 17, partial [Eschrichtius robustus]|nr:BTB/POZ domain-containing protein 17 [Eschrichtius robustus]
MLRLGYTKPGSWASFWAILTLVGLVTRAGSRAQKLLAVFSVTEFSVTEGMSPADPHGIPGNMREGPSVPSLEVGNTSLKAQHAARGPGAFSGCAVFLPAAAQKTDVGGEPTGTSINHSQTLLQRLQELLRQGNASDVVLRVQAAGTDEVRVFHAHRLLLGLHSELFRELLSNQSEVVLQEPRDGAAVFDKFISFQKTVLVGTRQHGRLLVRHAYSFHQSSEEAGDFLAHADLQRRNSEYLVENALHLHLIVKPVYHPLIRTPK